MDQENSISYRFPQQGGVGGGFISSEFKCDGLQTADQWGGNGSAPRWERRGPGGEPMKAVIEHSDDNKD